MDLYRIGRAIKNLLGDAAEEQVEAATVRLLGSRNQSSGGWVVRERPARLRFVLLYSVSPSGDSNRRLSNPAVNTR